MNNLFSEIGLDNEFPIREIKGRRHYIVDTPVSVSIVTLCDTMILIEKINEKWMFPSDLFIPKNETVQERASKILNKITEEQIDPKKWIPVDVRSHPNRIYVKNGQFSVDIGYASILELSDVPIIDTQKFMWVTVDLDNGKFPVPLIEDHDQLWESAFGVFDLLLKS